MLRKREVNETEAEGQLNSALVPVMDAFMGAQEKQTQAKGS